VTRPKYKDSVFINVPFDSEYRPLLHAIVFAIYDCGFVARSALETDDSGQARILKLYELIAGSKYGIHDISRTELDRASRLPRFNMPLELGVFLGAKQFGARRHRTKRALILDRLRYRYQRFCSDIAGQDIRAHNGTQRTVIRCVREWLRASPDTASEILPGARHMDRRYRAFRRQLPALCSRVNLDVDALTFVDYAILVTVWLRKNPR